MQHLAREIFIKKKKNKSIVIDKYFNGYSNIKPLILHSIIAYIIIHKKKSLIQPYYFVQYSHTLVNMRTTYFSSRIIFNPV